MLPPSIDTNAGASPSQFSSVPQGKGGISSTESDKKENLEVISQKTLQNSAMEAPLGSHRTSHRGSSNLGILGRGKVFFKRFFNFLKEEDEIKQLNEIEKQTKDFEKILQAWDRQAKNIRILEKGYSNRLPTQESVNKTAQGLKDAEEFFQKASPKFQLDAIKVKINTLCEKYPGYDHFQKMIQILEAKIQYLERSIKIHRELQELEKEIKEYHLSSEKTWEGFSLIREKKKQLAHVIQETIRNQQMVKGDHLSTADISRLIKRVYPHLSDKTDRLFGNLSTIHKQRMIFLHNKAKNITSLVSNYQKIAKEMNDLEKGLNDYRANKDRSTISKILHPTAIFFKPKRDKQDLATTKGKTLQDAYEALVNEGIFIPQEVEWFEKFTKRYPLIEHKKLEQAINRAYDGFLHVYAREEVAKHMDDLMESLKKYRLDSQQTRSMLTTDKSLEDSRKKIHDVIHETIKPMLEMTCLEHEKQGKRLSLDFKNPNHTHQLNDLIKITFSTLDLKFKEIMTLVEELSLEKKVNNVINETLKELEWLPLKESDKARRTRKQIKSSIFHTQTLKNHYQLEENLTRIRDREKHSDISFEECLEFRANLFTLPKEWQTDDLKKSYSELINKTLKAAHWSSDQVQVKQLHYVLNEIYQTELIFYTRTNVLVENTEAFFKEIGKHIQKQDKENYDKFVHAWEEMTKSSRNMEEKLQTIYHGFKKEISEGLSKDEKKLEEENIQNLIAKTLEARVRIYVTFFSSPEFIHHMKNLGALIVHTSKIEAMIPKMENSTLTQTLTQVVKQFPLLASISKLPTDGKMAMQSFLLEPTQRLAKFPLFARDIAKALGSENQNLSDFSKIALLIQSLIGDEVLKIENEVE